MGNLWLTCLDVGGYVALEVGEPCGDVAVDLFGRLDERGEGELVGEGEPDKVGRRLLGELADDDSSVAVRAASVEPGVRGRDVADRLLGVQGVTDRRAGSSAGSRSTHRGGLGARSAARCRQRTGGRRASCPSLLPSRFA